MKKVLKPRLPIEAVLILRKKAIIKNKRAYNRARDKKIRKEDECE